MLGMNHLKMRYLTLKIELAIFGKLKSILDIAPSGVTSGSPCQCITPIVCMHNVDRGYGYTDMNEVTWRSNSWISSI